MSPLVETLTLGARRYAAPVLVLAVVVVVVRWATRRTAVRAHAGPPSAGDLR
jgi:hypothetical protein